MLAAKEMNDRLRKVEFSQLGGKSILLARKDGTLYARPQP